MTPPVDAVVKGPGLYRITPERRAALDTIRYAEGTWNGGSVSGYLTLYGGGRFKSMARHPDVVVVRRYASAAAGAYQFSACHLACGTEPPWPVGVWTCQPGSGRPRFGGAARRLGSD